MIGFLNVYKPSGITSHDLVNQVRRVAKLKQVGHAGTLDPMAKGVMVIALSKACRLIQYLPDDKTYLAEILLGKRTDTDDIEGTVLEQKEIPEDIDEELIRKKLNSFKGKQIQIPPIYSAIKQGGMKMYDLARSGRAPKEIKGREIEVYSIELVSIELPKVKARISCSKGTYIRSIARDLGNQLMTGGCLSDLVREESGTHKLESSKSIEELSQDPVLESSLISPVDALGLNSIAVSEDIAKRVSHGQSISMDDLKECSDLVKDDFDYKNRFFICLDRTPIALMKGFKTEETGPEVVLTNANQL